MLVVTLILFCCLGVTVDGFTTTQSKKFGNQGQHLSAVNDLIISSIDSINSAVDQSLLGLLKFRAVDDGIPAGMQTVDAIAAYVRSAMPAFPTIIENTKLDGFVEGNDYLKLLDAANFPFLPADIRSALEENLLLWQRVVVGFLGADAGALVFDALVLKVVFGSLLSPSLGEVEPSGLPRSYDSNLIADFYANRPQLVLSRFLEILNQAKDFLLGILSDREAGSQQLEKNAPLRAKQLRELIAALGPTFIKVGQAISVRPDLLPPAYLDELVKLQDQVPPFSSDAALEILRNELQRDPAEVFEEVDASFSKPVAAASLGQVYKARLRGTGQEVAVKIQRPNMLVSVTLDLYIIRSLLQLGERYVPSIEQECRSFVLVVDNWAGRFVDELDYVKEVEHSNRFRSSMEQLESTLGDAIVVPQSFERFCTGKVLVTEWVEGNKLSAIDKVADSELSKTAKMALLKVLLNSYLVQLLETGFLHADPHPGNFLITESGKLCIMDYGLMTEVAVDKRYALLEYVAHLLAKDYAATLEDLVILEFIPPEIQADPQKRDIVAPLLAQVLEQLSGGGGAAAINVPEMGQQVEELAKQYPITIPAYFGLIVRAFGALEGIGLSIDPGYSITKECFPYLAKRLLSDDSERVRQALRTFLYGKNQQQLDLDRVEELAAGYRQFSETATEAISGNAAFRQLGTKSLDTTTTAGTSGSVGGLQAMSSMAQPRAMGSVGIDPAVEELLVDVVFSAQGNYVQELLVQEAVRISTALLRSVSWTILSGLTAPFSAPFSAMPKQLLPFPPGLATAAAAGAPQDAFRTGTSGSMSLTSQGEALGSIDSSSAVETRNSGVLNQRRERLRRIVGPTPEDVQALRTLKRLLEMIAGLPPRATGSNGNSVRTAGRHSEGTIDQADVVLLRDATQNILRLIDSSSSADTGQQNSMTGFARDARLRRETLRTVQSMLPVLRRVLPGATQLSRRYARSLLSTSLQRFAENLEQ